MKDLADERGEALGRFTCSMVRYDVTSSLPSEVLAALWAIEEALNRRDHVSDCGNGELGLSGAVAGCAQHGPAGDDRAFHRPCVEHGGLYPNISKSRYGDNLRSRIIGSDIRDKARELYVRRRQGADGRTGKTPDDRAAGGPGGSVSLHLVDQLLRPLI